MNENLNIPNIPGSGNQNFTDLSKNFSKSNNSIPPIPKKKRPARAFVKAGKKDGTNFENHEKCANRNGLKESETSFTDHLGICSISGKDAMIEKDKFNNGYLSPLDPPAYLDSSHSFSYPASPVGNYSQDCHPRIQHAHSTDSGIDDGDSHRGSGSVKYNSSLADSSGSPTSGCRLSTQYEMPYEDIDHYSRFNENQHDQHHQQQPASSVPGRIHDPPHTYMQLNTKKPAVSQNPSRAWTCCWLVVLLTIILIISLTALCLSIYHMIFRSKYCSRDCLEITEMSFDVNQTFSNMQTRIDDLISENEKLKEALVMQERKLVSFVKQEIGQLSEQYEFFNSTLDSMKSRFEADIANISLTPGIQGPPGVANYSLCVTKSKTMSVPASPTATTLTDYLPSEQDLQNYFVTFAYCTYTGATDANLDTQTNGTALQQRYRCKCWGQVSNISQTVCTLVVWMCPQES